MKCLALLIVLAACSSPAEPRCVTQTNRVLDVTTGDTVAITFTVCVEPKRT